MSETTTQSNLARALAAYVPGAVVEWLRGGDTLTPGETASFNAAALFADISGFTALVERLSRQGPEGIEAINTHLNAVFTDLIAQVHAFGGVVAYFGGDAITAYLPHEGDLRGYELARRAVTCALRIQGAVQGRGAIEAVGQRFEFGVKIGLAYGPLAAFVVGDSAHWLEFVIGGSALNQAVACEHHANRGQIVTEAEMVRLLGDALTGKPIEEDFFLVAGLDNPAEPVAVRAPEDWPGWLEDALRPYLAPSLVSRLEAGQGEPPADHRRVTCMFVNFKGPDYDAIDAGRRLQSYVRQAEAIIRRHGGYLSRVLTGDKGSQLHVVFGAPVAHEDDEVRAMACALALQRASFAGRHQQRVGVATGHVFAGPLGSDARREYTVIGDIVNLSARLMSLAAPGEVLVDERTQARANQAFDFYLLPPVQVKGKSAEVTPYRLMGERTATSALAARYLLSRRSIIGREAELQAIDRVIRKARQRRGQVIAFVGPVGVGKSRLIEELVRRWLEAEGYGYAGTAVSHGGDVPFRPWIDIWRGVFDLETEADEDIRRDKLVARLSDLSAVGPDAAALLGPLLDLEVPESPNLATLDARARQERLFEVCVEVVLNLAAHRPLLLILEELQWADASSLALLERLAAAIVDHPVLLCLEHRPELTPALAFYALAHVIRLDLEPLTAEEGWRLIGQIVGEVDWPADLRARLEARVGPATATGEATCTPLFAEEVVNSLLQTGALRRENGGYRVNPDAAIDIPDTLQGLLMTRIDQLEAPSRRLTQVASVIGRDFTFPVLAGVYPQPMPPDEMWSRLDGLVEAQLIYNTALQGQVFRRDRFRHALTQEIAYQSLPVARRRELHVRIADWIAGRIEGESDYATLAYHYDEGDVPDKAAAYALQAAAHAQSLYANAEALHLYAVAERNIARLDAAQRWPLEIQIGLNRGSIYLETGQYAQAEIDIQGALDLAAAHGDRLRQAQAFNLLAELRYRQVRFEEMAAAAEQAARIAEADGLGRELTDALRFMGYAYLHLGRRQEAPRPLQRALELARAAADRAGIAKTAMAMGMMYGEEHRLIEALEMFEEALGLVRPSGDKLRTAAYLYNEGELFFRRGEGERAMAAYREAIDIFRAIDARVMLGYALSGMCQALCFAGQYSAARVHIDEAERIFAENDDESGPIWCLSARGRDLERDLGEHEAARDHLQTVVEALRQTSYVDETLYAMLALADVQVRLDALDAAATTLEEAGAVIQQKQAHWFLPEHQLTTGRLAMARGDYAAAMENASRALAAVGVRGDPRTLPAIYRLLARALQALQPSDAGVIHDALERSVAAARGRARRLDLALSLNELGRFLKQRADRPTNQARGSGYLFEADLLFSEMGVRAPM